MDDIFSCGIIPVVKLNDAAKVVPLIEALIRGGISCLEITLRTGEALDAIAAGTALFPNFTIGAGTVLNISQLKLAAEAGAQFIVSPGFDAELAAAARNYNISYIPGVLTSSEIMTALKSGLTTLKFFPAEAGGGTAALKALHGPFADVRFLPTGGINGSNAPEYWKLSFVAAVGGSWVVPEKLIDAGEFSGITKLCAETTELARSIRHA